MNPLEPACEIVWDYFFVLLRIAHRRLHNEEKAEKAVFCAVNRFINKCKRGEVDMTGNIGGLLYKMVTTCCGEIGRGMDRQAINTVSMEQPVPGAEGLTVGSLIVDHNQGTDPERALMRTEFARRVGECLSKEKPIYRDVVILVDVCELPYEEAAKQIGVPVGTVQSRLFTARRHLRICLEGWDSDG